MGQAVAIIRIVTKPLGRKFSNQHEGYCVNLDLSLQADRHNGVASSGMVLSLSSEHRTLRPLLLVLKQLLLRRGLQTSHTGGLCSYGLVLMLARFLQEQEPASWKTVGTQEEDLGDLLLRFLRFFGMDFNPRTTGISVTRRCYFSRLSMMDKIHAMNNFSAGSVNSEGIQNMATSAVTTSPEMMPYGYHAAQFLPQPYIMMTTRSNAFVPMSPLTRRLSFGGKDDEYHATPSNLNLSGGSAEKQKKSKKIRLKRTQSWTKKQQQERQQQQMKQVKNRTTMGGTSWRHPHTVQNHHIPRAFVTRRGGVPFNFDPLLIEDPLFHGNNVGRNCFRITQVQQAWADALLALNFGKSLVELLRDEKKEDGGSVAVLSPESGKGGGCNNEQKRRRRLSH